MYAVLEKDTWEMAVLAVSPSLQRVCDTLRRGMANRKAKHPQLYPEGAYDEIIEDPKAAVDYLNHYERNAFQQDGNPTKDSQTVAVARHVYANPETLRTNGGRPRYQLLYVVVKLVVE